MSAATFAVEAIPILSDNYAWRLRCEQSGAVGVVDPADAGAVIARLEAEGGDLDLVLLTHHHADHIEGALEVARHFGARIAGAAKARHVLPPLDIALADGDMVALGVCEGRVMKTPGHAFSHLSFFFPDGPALFCGDVLFSLGCGRLLDGTAEEMFASLRRFDGLPDDTLVCCGHEYTESNARFALQADPGNEALQARAEEVRALRADGRPTVPSRLGAERAANPFLRAPDVATLADLRTRKDSFR